MRSVHVVWLIVALLLGAPARGEEDTQGRVRILIDRLGDRRPEVRKRAQEELLSLGYEAYRLAVSTLAPADPEVRRRIRALWRVPNWAHPIPGTRWDADTGLPREVLHKVSCIRMALVPPGSFWMGPGLHDPDRWPARRLVRITYPFYLGRCEVTRGQWTRVMRPDGPHPGRASRLPVTDVTYGEIERFLELTGLRLPTEAEWEYGCRAGETESRYAPIDEIAWHAGNSFERPWPVGCKSPNAFGLYDMLGNVGELCAGWQGQWIVWPPPKKVVVDPKPIAEGTYRIVRGGSFIRSAAQISAYVTEAEAPPESEPHIGFRVACSG